MREGLRSVNGDTARGDQAETFAGPEMPTGNLGSRRLAYSGSANLDKRATKEDLSGTSRKAKNGSTGPKDKRLKPATELESGLGLYTRLKTQNKKNDN